MENLGCQWAGEAPASPIGTDPQVNHVYETCLERNSLNVMPGAILLSLSQTQEHCPQPPLPAPSGAPDNSRLGVHGETNTIALPTGPRGSPASLPGIARRKGNESKWLIETPVSLAKRGMLR